MYEYWTLWPAPVHNTELNHSYYNPRLTYDPPAHDDGSPYAQMNAANTVNWTRVPADPWASTIKYVDLTQRVTVGMWCNSDWSVGLTNDPAHCRTNGTGASASSSSASTTDGDYNYPWAPPNIDPSAGSTTAFSIAYSKVDATTHALLSPWTTAQDPKYFYQNDNILWCDSRSPLWPQYGPVQTQTCSDPPPTNSSQTCQGVVPQTCGGGSPQSCAGVTPQTCNGEQSQQCNNLSAQTCGGAQGQSCQGQQSQTCNGVGSQTCDSVAPQTCDGVVNPSCQNVVPETCNNVQTQTCNAVSEVCNLPDPGTCPVDWIPPGCNLCTNECGDCHLGPVCGPGVCSVSGGQCQSNADCPGARQCSVSHTLCAVDANCPPNPGTCSVLTGRQCLSNADCPNVGACSNNGATCQSSGDCPSVAGTCSRDGTMCFNDGQCPPKGTCSIVGNTCQGVADCPTQPGSCSISHAPGCFSDAQCPDINGQCTVTHASCATDAQCPTVAGACNLDAGACLVNADCLPSGQCSIVASACHSDAECPIVPGACSTSGLACTSTCPTLAGKCDKDLVTACFNDSDCGLFGQTCSGSGLACNSASDCPPDPGKCSIETTKSCTADSDCQPQVTPGKCSIDHNDCTSDAMCPPLPTAASAAVCSDLVAGSTTLTVPVPNQSFEAPAIGDYAYNPAGGNWLFTGGSGITRYFGSFSAYPSGDGLLQAAFVQNLGSFSQTINLNPGSYRITFKAAPRYYSFPCCNQTQPVLVSVDGVALGSLAAPSLYYQYDTFSYGFSIAAAGPHTISFAGTDGSGDRTTFIDSVTITSGMSLLEDANGAGLVCRHNNNAYSGVSPNRYNYPDARFNTPVATGTGPNACVPSPRYAAVPRHYYKTGVEWCDAQVATAGDKWIGYGTRTTGSCQDSADVTHIYPR
ncbi:MAG: hypothetical protein E6H66_02045, partial [Betaproteobacteria bacterium]